MMVNPAPTRRLTVCVPKATAIVCEREIAAEGNKLDRRLSSLTGRGFEQ